MTNYNIISTASHFFWLVRPSTAVFSDLIKPILEILLFSNAPLSARTTIANRFSILVIEVKRIIDKRLEYLKIVIEIRFFEKLFEIVFDNVARIEAVSRRARPST